MKVKAMTMVMFKSWNDKNLGIEDCQMMRLHGKVFKGGFQYAYFLLPYKNNNFCCVWQG